jgi:uncharacterized membrane protein YqjE
MAEDLRERRLHRSYDGTARDRRDESIGALLKEFATDTSLLVRKEISLAQTELTEKARVGGKSARILAAAAVMGLATLGALTALLILVFAVAIPAWAAALVVTGMWAAVTAALAVVGRNVLRRASPATPIQTMETLREDAAWARALPQSGRR